MNSKFDAKIPILLVDDDAMVRDIIVNYLGELGFTNLRVAQDGREAFELMNGPGHKVKLILSDWEMPEVSGLGLLKAVRKNKERQDTKFIMVTSQRSMERIKISQAKEWHVDAYIVKPFRMETLRQKIYEVMGWNNDGKKQNAG